MWIQHDEGRMIGQFKRFGISGPATNGDSQIRGFTDLTHVSDYDVLYEGTLEACQTHMAMIALCLARGQNFYQIE